MSRTSVRTRYCIPLNWWNFLTGMRPHFCALPKGQSFGALATCAGQTILRSRWVMYPIRTRACWCCGRRPGELPLLDAIFIGLWKEKMVRQEAAAWAIQNAPQTRWSGLSKRINPRRLDKFS
ncbi:MAG: hypothetical protein GPOALKHO_001516 [Sodalis sp.]|nr:MAG: hypothetical protein GPOALKHO_001516 [Sodalis sp.]